MFLLAVFKLFASVQFVPSHNSQLGVGGLSPPVSAAAVCVPNPAGPLFSPEFKLFTSVQFVPSQVSVLTEIDGGPPPNATPDVWEPPAEEPAALEVFWALAAVHEEPSYNSVNSALDGEEYGEPPHKSPEFNDPNPCV